MSATVAIKERPILFRGPMVRAILEGRKTQTRRLVKYPGKAILKNGRAPMLVDWNRAHVDPGGSIWGPGPYLKVATAHPADGWQKDPEDDCASRIHCPYGYPEEGARLWVRESWRIPGDDSILKAATALCKGPSDIQFRATPPTYVLEGEKGMPTIGWRPSIHMPRWASRITLEVVKVRVERLQEITEEDAMAEGTGCAAGGSGSCEQDATRYIRGFRRSWDSHNKAPHDWASNPWVWVVEFKRVNAQQHHEATKK